MRFLQSVYTLALLAKLVNDGNGNDLQATFGKLYPHLPCLPSYKHEQIGKQKCKSYVGLHCLLNNNDSSQLLKTSLSVRSIYSCVNFSEIISRFLINTLNCICCILSNLSSFFILFIFFSKASIEGLSPDKKSPILDDS